MVMTMTKTCTTCNAEKALSEFHKSRGSKDGLQYTCKPCTCAARKAYREANRAVVAEKKKYHYEKNRAVVLEQQKGYRTANPQTTGTMNALRRSPLTEAELFAGLSRAEANAEVRFDYILRDLLTEKNGVQYHIDHIKPLCEGGVHRMWNLAVVTDQDNMKKGPVWFCEDHLTDEDIEAADAAALQEVHDASTVC